jgi:hypothetical protein
MNAPTVSFSGDLPAKYAAFTVAELGEMIVQSGKNGYLNEIWVTDNWNFKDERRKAIFACSKCGTSITVDCKYLTKAEVQKLSATQALKLQAYQAEMRRFTRFLKRQFMRNKF